MKEDEIEHGATIKKRNLKIQIGGGKAYGSSPWAMPECEANRLIIIIIIKQIYSYCLQKRPNVLSQEWTSYV